MTSRKPPANLIRPVLYPTAGRHPGMGAEQRTSAEVALMNDELRVEQNVAELNESYRVAGVDPEGNPVEQVRMTRTLEGGFSEGEIGLLKWEQDIEGGTLAKVVIRGQNFVVSATSYDRV